MACLLASQSDVLSKSLMILSVSYAPDVARLTGEWCDWSLLAIKVTEVVVSCCMAIHKQKQWEQRLMACSPLYKFAMFQCRVCQYLSGTSNFQMAA